MSAAPRSARRCSGWKTKGWSSTVRIAAPSSPRWVQPRCSSYSKCAASSRASLFRSRCRTSIRRPSTKWKTASKRWSARTRKRLAAGYGDMRMGLAKEGSALTPATGTASRRVATNPASVPAPIRAYYSNGVRVPAGSLLFISGQLGMDASGKLVDNDDVAAQAEQALRNIELLLEANGASLMDVVKVTVYVTDINYLDLIAPVRLKCFPHDGPASAIVEVARLALPDAKVEIEAIATVE